MYGWGGGLLSGGMQNMQVQNQDRNWGANADRNRWIAGVTGYSGDFGGGGFQNWAPSNGYDIGTLERLYSQNSQQINQQQGGWGQPPQQGKWQQTPQQAGWGVIPALQGLLGGYQPANGYGGGYYAGAPFGRPAAQPGFAGTFPPANSGSNMLWTV